jgi:hypothetical protein
MMAGTPISRKILLLLGTVTFMLAIAVIVAYGCARRTAREAETLLVDIQALHLNASLADAQRFFDAHPAAARVKEVKCTDERKTECELVVRLDNRWLAKLRLAPPTELAAFFTSSRGRIFRMGAGVIVHRVIPGTFSVLYYADVTEQFSLPESGLEPFYRAHSLANNGSGKFIPLSLRQRLDERATPEQRKLAYSSLNVSCLYKLGGCKDAEALAPSAWTAADKAGWHDETNIKQSH